MYTDNCICWYVKFNCFRDMIVLHKMLGEVIDELNEMVLDVSQKRKLLGNLNLGCNLTRTTV